MAKYISDKVRKLQVGISSFSESKTSLAVVGNVSIGGSITATKFVGDGSGLSGIVASGSGVVIKDDGTTVGTATTIDFGTNLSVVFTSGIATVNATGSASSATYALTAGIATYATSSGLSTYATTAGIATNAGYASTAGISTVSQGLVGTPNINVGIATATKYYGDGSSLTGIVASGSGIVIQNNGSVVGTATTIDFSTNLSVSFGSGIATVSANPGYATTSGISTYATTAGIATYATIAGVSTYATSSGIATYATTAGVSTYATSSGIATYATSSGIATYATNAGVSTSVRGGIGSVTQLQVNGISTFTSGPVLIGSGTSTGTASQRLQVTGGAYVSGSVGIGTTNPRENLDVIGSIGVQASGATNRFEIVHNTSLNSLDFIFL